MQRPTGVPIVIEQHADQLATLWAIRNGLRAAKNVGLRQLGRFDERIAAHQDGCVVAGSAALAILAEQFETVSAGNVFAAAIVGVELVDAATIGRCVAVAESDEAARVGLSSALGWVEAARLRGFVRTLLNSRSPRQRALGVTACRLHQVGLGSSGPLGLNDADAEVRAQAFRAAGALGDVDRVSFLSSVHDDHVACDFWAAWSAVLLGNRTNAVQRLLCIAEPHEYRARAFSLICQVLQLPAAHEMLRSLAADPTRIRALIEGAGIVGDPGYVPWLIGQMTHTDRARLAGDAFTLITGVDWSFEKLERDPPKDSAADFTSDLSETGLETESDADLPWPDVPKIEMWWEANAFRFQPGVRYLMGQPVTREHCIHVLKTGYQRQRILAAHYLCLLDPGTPLFNTSAPAWRQQKLLAQMA